jgi:RNA polymerase sigma-70 factor (ECF subfamily)
VVRELTHFADQALTGAQGGPDPAQLAEQDERREQLRAAMGRIPKKSAWVLALRYGGLSYQEVADALGVGIGQVGTLLRRAEITLRKEVQSGTSQ